MKKPNCCAYCSEHGFFEETLQQTEHTSIAICNHFGDVVVVAYGDEAVGFQPKFCPMCGRKINDE